MAGARTTAAAPSPPRAGDLPSSGGGGCGSARAGLAGPLRTRLGELDSRSKRAVSCTTSSCSCAAVGFVVTRLCAAAVAPAAGNGAGGGGGGAAAGPLARAGVKLAASAGCKFALLRAPPLMPPPTLRSWPGDAITVPLPLTSPLTTLPSRPTTEMRSEKRDRNAADMPGS